MAKLIHFFVVLATCAPVAAFGMGKGIAINKNIKRYNLRNVKLVGENRNSPLEMSRLTSMVVKAPRGGSVVDAMKAFNKSPSTLFNSSLITVAIITAAFKILQRASSSSNAGEASKKPKSVKDLQIRFLSVFWLLRCADWLQGPYFYEVYSSKVFNGIPASIALVSKLFLTGFASTALFGPLVGRALDTYGRKKGTLAFAFIYALGAASTKSPLLKVLFLGRAMSGIGTSLLFSAPESWLVAESQGSGDDPNGSWLGETFGLVCFCLVLFYSLLFFECSKHLADSGLCR